MRTVLGRSVGRATLILVSAGMVGSAALPAVPAAAVAGNPRSSVHHQQSEVRIGHAVKYVRDADGKVHRVR
ncbi:MAG: hypothetical protein QOJ03_1787 [Frankiaceae bacterium]|jgi:hypothetical protein|nr:hypothetical protein [Frankiaceae bacterium]